MSRSSTHQHLVRYRAPNTRVQRTRALAFARGARTLWVLARSPLTRHPLGGSWRGARLLAAVAVLTATASCETYNGKAYWAWKSPAFSAEASCRSGPTSSGGATILVDVRDEGGFPVPG